MFNKINYLFEGKLSGRLVFFLSCIIYFGFNYSFLEIPPTSIHFIRQTDSLSFVLYYFNKSDYNFFNVGNLSLSFTDGKTACEFPIFYYAYFLIFKMFGIDFMYVRLVSLIICSLSIGFAVIKSNEVLRNWFLSISVVLMTLSSSVYRYYSINFLPDSLAVSFAIIGTSLLLVFIESKQERFLLYSLIWLTISTMIKIYYGIYLILAIGILFIEKDKIQKKRIVSILLCGFFIIAWYSYSILYNYFNHANYYLTNVTPIWNMTIDSINQVKRSVINYWYTKYYLPTIFHTIAVIAVIPLLTNLMDIKKRLILATCFILCLIYFFLFYRQFRDHDYYFMTFIPFVFLLCVLSLQALIKRTGNVVIKNSIVLVVFLVGVLGFNYTSLNIYRRFNNSIDNFSLVSYQLRDSDKYLKIKSISSDSKFLVIGDKTINGSLVFLNRTGWTYPNFNSNLESISSNLDKADFLVVLSPSKNKPNAEVESKLKKCQRYSYLYNDIYDLKNY